MAIKTPLGYLADRFTLSPRSLRWASTAALIVSILIVVGGGVVRVTGSGLGCPTWPTCDASSLAPTPELGIHAIIEFSNRMLTTVLCVAVAWVIIAARLQKPRIRSITRLAWSQFWLVVANAVIGGITVWMGLNPYVVAFHFIAAMALLTATTLTWHRVHESASDRPQTAPAARGLSYALVACTIVLIMAGTLVSGSGPHSGDSADVPRMAFDWAGITVVHGVLGAATLGIAVLLWFALRGSAHRLARLRTVLFIVVVLAQGAIGIVQALTGLPSVLVVLHLVGAALVWVGALRVLLDVNPALFPGVPPLGAGQHGVHKPGERSLSASR
jgi:cytochrome c oxidase assembly protein subunit 15